MYGFKSIVLQNHEPKWFLSGWQSFLLSEFFLASSSAPVLLLILPMILRVGIPLSASTVGCDLEAVPQAHLPHRGQQ